MHSHFLCLCLFASIIIIIHIISVSQAPLCLFLSPTMHHTVCVLSFFLSTNESMYGAIPHAKHPGELFLPLSPTHTCSVEMVNEQLIEVTSTARNEKTKKKDAPWGDWDCIDQARKIIHRLFMCLIVSRCICLRCISLCCSLLSSLFSHLVNWSHVMKKGRKKSKKMKIKYKIVTSDGCSLYNSSYIYHAKRSRKEKDASVIHIHMHTLCLHL